MRTNGVSFEKNCARTVTTTSDVASRLRPFGCISPRPPPPTVGQQSEYRKKLATFHDFGFSVATHACDELLESCVAGISGGGAPSQTRLRRVGHFAPHSPTRARGACRTLAGDASPRVPFKSCDELDTYIVSANPGGATLTEAKGIRCLAHPDSTAVRVCAECRTPICWECAFVVGMSGARPMAKTSPQEAYCRACADRISEEARAARPDPSTAPRAAAGAVLGAVVGGVAYSALSSQVSESAGWYAPMVGLLAGTAVLSMTAGKRSAVVGLLASFGTIAGYAVAAWRLGTIEDLGGYIRTEHQLTGSAVGVMVAFALGSWRPRRRCG